MKEKLPIHWGNRFWIRDKNGLVVPTKKKVGKKNPKWIDYRKLPGNDTTYFRQPPYPHWNLRVEFTDQIIDEVLETHNDCVSSNPVCIYTCGGTASGKTSAVDTFLSEDDTPYLRIDFDSLKRSLPEYSHMVDQGIKEASEYTSAESAKMAGKLFKKGLKKRLNLIYEKTNACPIHTLEEVRKLRRKGYMIFVVATHLDEPEAQRRAQVRYKSGGRYVPPTFIAGTYTQVPESLKTLQSHVDGLLLFDNNSEVLSLMAKCEGHVTEIIDETLYSAYLDRVGAKFDLRSEAPI